MSENRDGRTIAQLRTRILMLHANVSRLERERDDLRAENAKLKEFVAESLALIEKGMEAVPLVRRAAEGSGYLRKEDRSWTRRN